MMRRPFVVSFVAGLMATVVILSAPAAAGAAPGGSDEADRVKESAVVFTEIMGAGDKAIPQAILDKAAGIAIFPGTLKAGFVFGAQRGRGLLIAKSADGWSSPAFLTLTGGSFGAQIGGQAIDIVLVIMNQRGLENLVRNQFKMGADASVAAGPVGRDAEAATDLAMRAQILSYSRARGLFAGVTLKGSVVKEDQDANLRFYGSRLRTREIVFDHKGGAPAPVGELKAVVSKYAK